MARGYEFCALLRGFDRLTPDEAAEVIAHLVEALSVTNAAWLRSHPQAPWLYHSGVYYCRDGRPEEQWYDYAAVLDAGCADCKALAAARIAELRTRLGIYAVPHVTTDDGSLFHVTVRIGNYLEDPSELLGM